MKYRTDLILGEAFCIFIFFYFLDSGLSVLNGLQFYFWFRDSENPQLEEEITKLKEVEIVPYITDVRKQLLDRPSSGIKDGGRPKLNPSDAKPATVSRKDSVHKLLATSLRWANTGAWSKG